MEDRETLSLQASDTAHKDSSSHRSGMAQVLTWIVISTAAICVSHVYLVLYTVTSCIQLYGKIKAKMTYVCSVFESFFFISNSCEFDFCNHPGLRKS